MHPGVRVEAISPFGADDRLVIQSREFTAALDVVSRIGIGWARLSAAPGGWPQRLLVRLHVRALEGFEAWSSSWVFSYALDHEENVRRHRRAKAGEVLEPICVELPGSLFEDSAVSVELQWVDWCRE